MREGIPSIQSRPTPNPIHRSSKRNLATRLFQQRPAQTTIIIFGPQKFLSPWISKIVSCLPVCYNGERSGNAVVTDYSLRTTMDRILKIPNFAGLPTGVKRRAVVEVVPQPQPTKKRVRPLRTYHVNYRVHVDRRKSTLLLPRLTTLHSPRRAHRYLPLRHTRLTT